MLERGGFFLTMRNCRMISYMKRITHHYGYTYELCTYEDTSKLERGKCYEPRSHSGRTPNMWTRDNRLGLLERCVRMKPHVSKKCPKQEIICHAVMLSCRNTSRTI
jgi:hypothetical protein